ncbi:MAG: cell division protein FtsA [Candidatus Kerfeldbacteria bacterium CG08_land_8_20_14_0_20_42_7]|uniref:Cell division protein FtsA n=1 Tax=Candidatus Kerfeldbacteria bacterium CG08_land_8_20_14_0_20_42_7 TaxID=2014245 RepID=A0A2H0YST7_9BACT|nr:MAG: cell division protein FtsA [Candidatus Kerfeldbacteria bacterium CG08_land_8_20_14_0_20_42_7]
MAKDNIITGLDIGSTSIRVAVGSLGDDQQGLQIIGIAEHPAEGISKGVVTSIEDAVSSVSSALVAAERMTGVPIEHAYVGMNGGTLTSQEGHGVVAVAKANGEIHEEDVERVIDAAQAVSAPPNNEILHVIPRSFTVDNQAGIKDPIGMSGIRLEVDAQIILALSSQVKNIQKVIYRTGIDIDDIVLGILASSEAILSKREKELGVCLVNIGSNTTSLMVFEEGDVLHTAILPVGAGHITNDIAIGLRTSIDIAEKIKLEHGTAVPKDINKHDEIDLSDYSPNESGMVSKKHVSEIIEARLEEIYKMIDKELQTCDRAGLLPAGIVFTGGGAKLPGVIELAKQVLKLPASVGVPREKLVTAIDRARDPIFATALGLVSWGAVLAQEDSAGESRLKSVGHAGEKVKNWFKSLLP